MATLELEILNKKLIKPLNSTPYHLRKLNLSLFDQLAPKIYASIIYYYSGNGGDGEQNRANSLTAQKIDRLEKSLSRALVHLYPLAGRFQKDDVSVDCSDQGVEFWQARVSCKLAEFLQQGPDIELVDKFLPWEIPPAVDLATSPQLAIQVNTFDDGGIVVGVRISHILTDAATMSLLMEKWAAACRDVESVSPIPVASFHHEIARVFPVTSSLLGFNHLTIAAPPPTNEANKIVTRRFLISSKLLTKFKNNASNSIIDCQRRLSKFVVVLALVWKSLMGMSMAKHGYLRDSVLSIAMNLRGKVSLGMKKTSKAFGNFFISVIVPFVAAKACKEVDLYDVIILLSNTIAETRAKIASASTEDTSTMLINSKREVIEKCKNCGDDGLDVYFCSSWHGALSVYETDFGWGRPIWASISTQHAPGVCLMDSSDADGIELWVSLKQSEMLPFQQQFYDLASMSNL